MAENDSKEGNTARLQIILAVMSLAGVLGAAFLANIDKIFPPKKDVAAVTTPRVPDDKPATAPVTHLAVAGVAHPAVAAAIHPAVAPKTRPAVAVASSAGAGPNPTSDLRGIRLTRADAERATFEVGYSFAPKDPRPISIAIKVYSAVQATDGAPPAGKPRRVLLGQGETSVTGAAEGTASVNVERSVDPPTEIGFVEVQLVGGNGPILVKQVPFARVWNR
jgi:hypothetical protein